MADVYLRSTDGNDADDGSTWALADATAAASVVAAGAGGRSFVSQSHAETQATDMTITFPGGPSAPNQLIGVSDAAEPPTSMSTAPSITTTGRSGITVSGSGYVYGITFNVGTGTLYDYLNFGLNNAKDIQLYEKCVFNLNINHTLADINIGAATNAGNGRLLWKNCDIKSTHIGSSIILVSGLFHWHGGSWLGTGASPTTVCAGSGVTNRYQSLLIEDVDLSACDGYLVDVSGVNGGNWIFRNCKLSALLSGFITGTWIGPSGAKVIVENCDSGDTNYKFYHGMYEGSVQDEGTIVRSGGASDGVTSYSQKMVSTANTGYPSLGLSSLLMPTRIAAADVGVSKTVTVEIVHDSVGSGASGALQDDELVINVHQPNISGSTQYQKESSVKADVLAAATDIATSTETWVTTGLTSPVKQKPSVTFTPQEEGMYLIEIKLFRPSTTVYVDAVATVT